MIRQFLVWLQTEFMKGGDYSQTWSEALLGSLNFWGLLEGTHLLFLMLFAGSIFIVDFRLMGWTFKRTPVSVISDRVLPLTVFGFIALVITGAALFYAKPLAYYHNVWFRLKLVFLALAMLNIMLFHSRVQRNQEAWDADPVPPTAARVSAGLSLTAWVLVITMGRFIAYDWFDCGKPAPHFMNVVQECAASDNVSDDLGSTINSNAGKAQ